MAENSAIAWTDHTFNPWIGCTKISTGPHGGCENCYAERDNRRRRWVPGWGPGEPRRMTMTWGDPRRWDRKAQDTGYRPRVFCASLADVFDNEVPDVWRSQLWTLIRQTPHLRWMLLTKRIGNAAKMLPLGWPSGFGHVGLMATVVTQEEADRDIPKLLDTEAAWHGISAEPLQGPLDLSAYLVKRPGLDWVIVGGESGPRARRFDPDWARTIRDQCRTAEVAFFMKQMSLGAGVPDDLLIREFPDPLR